MRAVRGKLDAGAKMADSCPGFLSVKSVAISLVQAVHTLEISPYPYRRIRSSVMPLCAKVMKGSRICGCYFELSARAKVG